MFGSDNLLLGYVTDTGQSYDCSSATEATLKDMGNASHESSRTDDISTTKQSKTNLFTFVWDILYLYARSLPTYHGRGSLTVRNTTRMHVARVRGFWTGLSQHWLTLQMNNQQTRKLKECINYTTALFLSKQFSVSFQSNMSNTWSEKKVGNNKFERHQQK